MLPAGRPLVDGGPARLARHYGIDPENGYVDECHCCYLVRRRLIDRFPDYLAPPQVYGPGHPPQDAATIGKKPIGGT